jgi:hypothetical protein
LNIVTCHKRRRKFLVRLAEMPAVAEIQREKPRPLEIKPNACGKKRGLTSSAGANNWIRTDDL